MRRKGPLDLPLSLPFAAGLLLILTGCGGGSTPPPPPVTPTIKHVVIIFQENRTPDNLFQDPILISRGADIAASGLDSLGQTIPLAPITLANDYDLDHHHSAFVAQYHGGAMDGADQVSVVCDAGATDCPPANPQFMYVNPAEVQPYFQLAEQYTFGDRMFQTHQGPSFPAHQFILAGTSAPSVGSNLFVAENPEGSADTANDTGCTAPPGQTVALIDPDGSETATPPIFPCFEHQTLTDLLHDKGVSWRYYAPSPGSIWTAPNAIRHMCVPSATFPPVCTGSDWTNNVVLDQTQVLTDVANHQLPQMSWVIPNGKQSDHPSANDGTGPSWVASVVNAIGNSSYWADTAIIITWDDWGGWYDHVAPPVINSYEYGFRVPLIVVSPYAKAGYISKQTHDFGSILKFVEKTFSLPSLNYADATADDLSDCFNFKQTPIVFQTINAPVKAGQFLSDKSPHTDPDTY